MEVETSESESDDENQESGELEEEENSIAKYQFKLSEATCLTDNAPEARVNVQGKKRKNHKAKRTAHQLRLHQEREKLQQI